LRRELRTVTEEREILKKDSHLSGGLLRQGKRDPVRPEFRSWRAYGRDFGV
jgi:hypothetical protein